MSIQQAILFGGWDISIVESFCEDHFNPNDEKGVYFSWMAESCMEGCRMHIWALQSKWWLLSSPVEMWDKVCIQDMDISCIILHNMMVME